MNERHLQSEREKLKAEFARYGTNHLLPKRGKSDRLARFETDIVGFGETYFPHRVKQDANKQSIVTPEHRELLALCNVQNTPVMALMYRGSAKSTWGTVIDTLHKLYYRKFHAGIIGSYDADTATANFLSAIFLEIETNARLRQDFGDIAGEYKWSVSDFITATGIRLAARGIHEMVKGFNNPVNGARLDLFKGDDLQKRESARSPKQVTALMDWLWEEVYLALREAIDGGAYFHLFGTCVDGGTDAMTQMLKDTSRAMRKLVVPMVLDEPSRVIDTTIEGASVERVITPATGLPHWMARYTLERCDGVCRNVGNAKFAAEMQQHPLSAKHKAFRVDEWLRYLAPSGDVPIPDWATHTQIIGRADPSSTKTGDRKAIVILSSAPGDWRVFVRHVFLQQCSVEEFLDALHEISRLYRCQIGVEDNALKEWLWKDIQYFEQDNGCHLPLYPVHSSLNKDWRIKQLQSPMQRGVFVAQRGHSDVKILVDEADMYPNGAFDDGVDAWSGAYQDLMVIKESDADADIGTSHSTGTARPIAPVSLKTVFAGLAGRQ